MAGVQDDYDEIYRSTDRPPWEIGGPQPALARVLDDVKGPAVLDIGCGSGDLALALARRGHRVTGVDFSPVAIGQARLKAAAEGLSVDFQVQDATRLALPAAPFDAVFDSGLLHTLVRHGGAGVDTYLASLPGLAAPGAPVFVLAVSLAAGHDFGVTEEFLRAGFAEPWWTGTRIEAIEVAARAGREPLALGGYLLRTARSASTSR